MPISALKRAITSAGCGICIKRSNADEFITLADIYDDLELFEISADYWFRFLDECEEDERAEAYEGLYHCYYNLGNRALEEYYYRLLKQERERMGENMDDADYYMDGDGPDEEEPASPRPRLRLVWPPEKADHTPEIAEGLAALRRGDYAEAAEQLASVPPQAPQAASFWSGTRRTCRRCARMRRC